MRVLGFFVQITAFIWLLLAGALVFRGAMELIASAISTSSAGLEASIASAFLAFSGMLMAAISWQLRKFGLNLRGGMSVKEAIAGSREKVVL